VVVFILLSVISAVITAIIQKYDTIDSARYKSASYSLYCIWAILTSVSVPKIPERALFRILFLLWVCYSLILSTVFQSFFTSFLIEPIAQKQISSFKELMGRGLALFGDMGLMMIWFETLPEEEVKKFKTSDTPITDFSVTENSAIFAIDLEMQLLLKEKLKRGLKPCYFVYSSHEMYTTSFLASSVYLEGFNSRVLQSLQAGLFSHQINNYSSSISESLGNITLLENKLKQSWVQTEDYFTPKIEHLSVVFYLLLCGIFIVCLAEGLRYNKGTRGRGCCDIHLRK